MKLIEFFDRGVAQDPQRDCLIDESGRFSFREAQVATHQIACGLRALGAGQDVKVGLWSPNASRAFLCELGIFRSDAVWVPLNARNSVADNCRIIADLDVEILFLHSEFAGELAAITASCPKVRHVICVDKPGLEGMGSVDKWLATDLTPIESSGRPSSTVTAILSSGGTTGRSKGVVHTDLVWSTLIANLAIAMPPKKAPVHLLVAPMTHGAGALALCLMHAGATQVVMRSFDAEQVLQNIEKHRVTHLFLPPTAIYMLLAHQKVRAYDYSSLEYFVYAAAPMSTDRLVEALDVFGPVMAQTYGQAEAPMLATYLSPTEHLAALATEKRTRLLSAGRSTLLAPVAIMDDQGTLLPPGRRGEVVIRGDLVMQGYYRDAQATAETQATNGWHRTGDIGELDSEGYLTIVDRKRDMIISGGFNLYPGEIEQVIWSHPAVQDCAVIGVPDDKWGEAVKAVIEVKPGQQTTEAEILDQCRKRLGGMKTPKSVEFWPSLPRTPVGKVSKREIREKFWQGKQRKI